MLNRYPSNTPFTQPMSREAFFSKVMNLFGFSLLVAAAGSWVSWDWGPAIFFPAVIAEFVFLFAIIFVRKNQELRGLFLALFSLSTGIVLVPLLRNAVAVGGPAILVHALGITGITFLGLSLYAVKSGKDFSFLGGILFGGLIAIVIAGFVGFFFRSPLFVLGYSVAGAVLFSGFVLYDMSNVMRRYGDDQYVDAALALYLDFLNLFVFILQILMEFGGGGNRRWD